MAEINHCSLFLLYPPFLPTHTPSTPPSSACKGGTLACEELKWTIAADSSRNRARAACMTEVYRQACTDSNISGAGLQGAARTGSAPRSGLSFPWSTDLMIWMMMLNLLMYNQDWEEPTGFLGWAEVNVCRVDHLEAPQGDTGEPVTTKWNFKRSRGSLSDLTSGATLQITWGAFRFDTVTHAQLTILGYLGPPELHLFLRRKTKLLENQRRSLADKMKKRGERGAFRLAGRSIYSFHRTTLLAAPLVWQKKKSWCTDS